jgi:hypothetical protein
MASLALVHPVPAKQHGDSSPDAQASKPSVAPVNSTPMIRNRSGYIGDS